MSEKWKVSCTTCGAYTIETYDPDDYYFVCENCDGTDCRREKISEEGEDD